MPSSNGLQPVRDADTTRAQTLVATFAPGALLATLVAGYLAFIRAYGVDVPHWDDWTLGEYFLRWAAGELRLHELLIAKNNEHLIGVPFTLMSLFYAVSDYHVKLILYLSAAIQFSALAIFLALTWTLLPPRPWRGWHAVLISLLFLSLAPVQNILWAFQTAWNLITLFFLSALWFLDRATRCTGPRQTQCVLLAGVFAALASFSSIQGLITWIGGAAFLVFGIDVPELRRRLTDRRLLLWFVLAFACLSLYGWVYSLTPTPHLLQSDPLRSVASDPLAVPKFMVLVMSSAWGHGLQGLVKPAGIVALVICAVALSAALLAGQRKALAVPLALAVFGVLCSLMVALGRVRFGEEAALQSRYASNVLLALAGSYIVLIRVSTSIKAALVTTTLQGLLAVVVIAAFVSSAAFGITAGRFWRLDKGIGALILRNAANEPRFKIERTLCWNADLVLQQAPHLQAQRLTTFAGRRRAIPGEAMKYIHPPLSFAKFLEERPEHRAAIVRLWDVYIVGPDLRASIALQSPSMPVDLLRWAAVSARGNHYLAKHLLEYADDYERMRAEIDSAKDRAS